MRPTALFAVLALFLSACGGGTDSAESEGTPESEAPASDVATTAMGDGSISGAISFAGTPAERAPIRMKPECMDLHDSVPLDEDILVGEGGAVQNAFVYVSGGLPEGYSYATPSEAVVLDQEGCMYTPRVLGAQVGQTIRIENSDHFQHNVNAGPELNRGFNESTPNLDDYLEKSFRVVETMISVKCDVHTWMQAWIGVLDHPYYATTDASGAFSISGLPAGEYTVTAWHETLGEQQMQVTVAEGGAAEANITL